MKIIFFLFLFYSTSVFVFSIIPNWNMDKIGIQLFDTSSEKYNYTIFSQNLDGLELKMTREIYSENNTIKYKNYIKVDNFNENVSFDYIESFYKINNDIIICPKGAYHPFNLADKKELIPTGFVNYGLKDWDLKCKLRPTSTDNTNVFIVFYLMNNNKTIFYKIIGEDKWGGNLESISKESYDFKLSEIYFEEKGKYPMISIIKDNSNHLTLQGKVLYFTGAKGWFEPSDASKVDIIESKTYTQAYFNDKTNSYYFISYDNISNFISGYYLTKNIDISFKGFSDWYPIENNNTPFEFLDDEVEIEKMNFVLYNNFVYYRIRSKNNNDKIYHGILDIKTNKVIFNTDETIYNFIPNKDISMLAITSSKAYEICFYKDSEGNCIENCENNKYRLDIDGNICSENNDCKNGKLILIPNEICIENCDNSIYISNGTHCGLCKDLNTNNKEYKLINGTECIEYNSTSMEYFNEKLKLLKCKDGFILKDNDCISDFKCYELCEEGKCTQPSDNISNQYCTECIENFFLYEGNCNQNCPERYKTDNSSKKCLQCNDTNCITYFNNTCNCSKCNEAYFINLDNICEKCPNNCTSCKNSTMCEKCENGFFVNSQGNCTPCPTENCQDLEEDKCHCLNCKDGYFKYQDKCQKCHSECETCSINETNCTSCKTGKYLTTENKCKSCGEKCQTCESNPNNVNDICLTCNLSSIYKYLVNDDFNKTCVENCTNVGREFNINNNTCKAKKNESDPRREEEPTTNNDTIHLWIIFAIIIGIVLLVIAIIIIKKCLFEKNKRLYSDEINTQLTEFNEIAIN